MHLKRSNKNMESRCITILTYGFLALTAKSRTSALRRNSAFDLYAENTRLEADIIATKSTDVISLCAQFCLSKCHCKSFNLNPTKKLCQILSKSHEDIGSSKLTSVIGWHYYMKTSKLVSNSYNSIFWQLKA